MISSRAYFLVSLFVCAVVGCGGDGSPTSGTGVGSIVASEGDVGFGSIRRHTDGPTVEEILQNPQAFFGQQVELQGELTQPLGPSSFLFNDGTGSIPADFTPQTPTPGLNEPIVIRGQVVAATGDFAARVTVLMWEEAPAFSCDDIQEIRARFTDPGFVAGDVVGYYLAYRGTPAGEKVLDMDWGDGNTESFEVGEGRARGDGLFDLEGVVAHEYSVSSQQTFKVRATLRIIAAKVVVPGFVTLRSRTAPVRALPRVGRCGFRSMIPSRRAGSFRSPQP